MEKKYYAAIIIVFGLFFFSLWKIGQWEKNNISMPAVPTSVVQPAPTEQQIWCAAHPLECKG